jgi:hypothetical protein
MPQRCRASLTTGSESIERLLVRCPPNPTSCRRQGCHNGRFWMKISVRTSADVVRTSARVRIYPRTWQYVRVDARDFQFSVFNPRNPQNPQNPRAPRASRAKLREEEGFFGLVPLVTHPSSILLLGGLTPKFLSLSLHSL